MSMSLLSALQCLAAFLTYFFMSVIVPSIVFGKRFKHLDLNQRFIAYFTIGNFYMINVVYALQLIHISNKVTLFLATFIPAAVMFARNNQISIADKIKNSAGTFNRLIIGRLGAKTALSRLLKQIKKLLIKLLWKIKEIFIDNIIDWILLVCFTVLFLKIFGSNMVTNFGYAASDIPVHNYWINYLSKNEIFVAGIYPFGFHCIIYYLHEIFNIDTYVLLRVFCVVQTFFVDLMILNLLKYCCKTKYTPYLGIFIYMAVNIFSFNTYGRFYSTLPQEFGMLFIYPSVYFAFAFFKERKKELKLEKDIFPKVKSGENGELKIKRRHRKLRVRECFSTWYLAGFAMSFSMTLAVHFYGTMIAGLFCVGIAAGFLFRFIRPKYFWRVLATFIISVFIAVLPMGIAYLQGTPLQGSLGWGMNVLKGKSSDDEADEKDSDEQQNNNIYISGSALNVSGEALGTSGSALNVSGEALDMSGSALNVSGTSAQISGSNSIKKKSTFSRAGFVERGPFKINGTVNLVASDSHSLFDLEKLEYRRSISFYVNLLKKNPHRFVEKIRYVSNIIANKILDATQEYVFRIFDRQQTVWFYMASFFMLIVGILLFVFRQYDYGAAIISTVVFLICMALLLAAGRIGLPTLMDAARCSIYFAYMVPLLAAFAVDFIIFTAFGWLKWKWVKWIRHLISLGVLAAAVLYCFDADLIKNPHYTHCFETNEAVTCLTNIIREEEDYTWTICSANDETRMGEDHGYHYETIQFLREMEVTAGREMLTIPTRTVYFFIEKIPIDYPQSYEGSGQRVSREGASRYLPMGGGLSVYQKENRWIVMSRMYYWAQEFRKLYPNEMKVYMETDNFVCYKIEQNTYRLYNFAIDYKYNTEPYIGNVKVNGGGSEE